MARYTWQDLMCGEKDKDVSIFTDDAGLFNFTINGETILRCTKTEAKFIFASMSRFFGKRESKKLINVKKADSEKWEE